MGLADRDYARKPSGRGFDPTGTSSLGRVTRGWSANTWIMVVCIAVFFIDILLGSMGGAITQTMGRVGFVGNSGLVRDAAVLPRQPGLANPPPDAFLPGSDFVYLIAPADRLTAEQRARVQVVRVSGQGEQAVVGIERVRTALPLQALGHFSTGKGFLELQVWRLVTFQFLHADINHLILNMIGLFFFGAAVESRLGAKRYLSFFLACGIAGALLYLTLNFFGRAFNLQFFGLLNYDLYVPLIGASGGVFGVLMAAAHFSRPGDKILLFFVIPLPIKVGAYGILAVEFIRLIMQADNAGGSAAHIGGALAGLLLVRRIGILDQFLDIFGGSKRGRGRGEASGRKPGGKKGPAGPTRREQERLDAILDKVSAKGLQSLSDDERAFLEKMSKDG